jgi:glycosyltransferase involved in cell wall biosynthesis
VPHVMTLHSPFPFDGSGEWKGDADMYYMEWIKKVPIICISESARREITLPLSVVGVVHHGLDQSAFRPSTVRPAEYFAWLGRMVPEKGPHLAIQAAREARVRIVLAGIVDPGIQNAVDYFRETIRSELDGQEVSYIGPVNTEQKIHFLSRARGLLNPIQWEEPFGMVMIEALAVGCPVIAFARGAAPEIVSHQKSGFLVDDVRGMAEAINNIDQIARPAVRRYFEEHFSAQTMAKNYARTINE